MKGARADDSVKTIKSDSNNRKTIIGPSHHRFEVFIKYQNSPNIEKRSLIEWKNPISKI